MRVVDLTKPQPATRVTGDGLFKKLGKGLKTIAKDVAQDKLGDLATDAAETVAANPELLLAAGVKRKRGQRGKDKQPRKKRAPPKAKKSKKSRIEELLEHLVKGQTGPGVLDPLTVQLRKQARDDDAERRLFQEELNRHKARTTGTHTKIKGDTEFVQQQERAREERDFVLPHRAKEDLSTADLIAMRQADERRHNLNVTHEHSYIDHSGRGLYDNPNSFISSSSPFPTPVAARTRDAGHSPDPQRWEDITDRYNLDVSGGWPAHRRAAVRAASERGLQLRGDIGREEFLREVRTHNVLPPGETGEPYTPPARGNRGPVLEGYDPIQPPGSGSYLSIGGTPASAPQSASRYTALEGLSGQSPSIIPGFDPSEFDPLRRNRLAGPYAPLPAPHIRSQHASQLPASAFPSPQGVHRLIDHHHEEVAAAREVKLVHQEKSVTERNELKKKQAKLEKLKKKRIKSGADKTEMKTLTTEIEKLEETLDIRHDVAEDSFDAERIAEINAGMGSGRAPAQLPEASYEEPVSGNRSDPGGAGIPRPHHVKAYLKKVMDRADASGKRSIMPHLREIRHMHKLFMDTDDYLTSLK
jgi:hypothetical protein